MAIPRQEIESPMLWDWEFEDELGIVIDVGRFIIPNQTSKTIGSRMGKYKINDGRTVISRTETFREADAVPIKFANMPYNYVMEFENRVGVRFKVRNHLGDFMWLALDTMESMPLHMMAWAKTEQMYNVTLNFIQVNPI